MTVHFGAGYSGPVDHPHIGWQRYGSALDVTSTGGVVAGFPAVNAADPYTTTWWQQSGASASWSQRFYDGVVPVALSVSYICIVPYVQAFQYQLRSINLDGTAAIIPGLGAIQPTDGGPIFAIFNPLSCYGVRVFTEQGTNAAPPIIASIFTGQVMAWTRKAEFVGSTSIQRAQNTEYRTGMTDGGQFIGRTIRRKSLSASMTVRNLSEDWLSSDFDPFADAADDLPFIMADRPNSYPKSLAYGWTSERIIPARDLGLAAASSSVTINMTGHRNL
jgi:hypothetical protein